MNIITNIFSKFFHLHVLIQVYLNHKDWWLFIKHFVHKVIFNLIKQIFIFFFIKIFFYRYILNVGKHTICFYERLGLTLCMGLGLDTVCFLDQTMHWRFFVSTRPQHLLTDFWDNPLRRPSHHVNKVVTVFTAPS